MIWQQPPGSPPMPTPIHSTRRRPTLLGLSLLVLSGIPSSAAAQVVQLPTLRQFGIGTTIVVPDRGTAILGGVSRGAWSRTSRGTPLLGTIPGIGRPFRQDAIGGSVGTSQAAVTATILDLEELDRAVLEEGQRLRESRAQEKAARAGIESPSEAQRRRAAFLNRSMGRPVPPDR